MLTDVEASTGATIACLMSRYQYIAV